MNRSALTPLNSLDTLTSSGGASLRRSTPFRIDFSRKMYIRRAGEREAALMMLICALDMYSTLWWVLTGRAHEANKLLAWTFAIDPILFVIVKCASSLPALLLAPRLAERYPKLTIGLLRFILAAYLISYVVGVYMTSFRA